MERERMIDADALIELIKTQAHCEQCDNYNGVKCRACVWKDAMDMVDDYANNHPFRL